MKVRYTINDRGELEARDGTVLGRVVGLTLDLGRGGTIGGSGEPPTSTSAVSSEVEGKTEGGAGETEIPPDVAEVWSYWLDRRQPPRTDMERSQGRMIVRGIGATDVPTLKEAIDGLLASDWHREHKQLYLSTILKTKPGGASLRDQIEGFAELAPSPAGSALRSATAQVRSEQLKAAVLRIASFRQPTDRDLDDRATAVAELQQLGISTIFNDAGWPTFEAAS